MSPSLLCSVETSLSSNAQLKPRRPRTTRNNGVAQLSVVEHALCPLDTRVSIQPGLIHETAYEFSDKHRNRRTAQVQVGAAFGLSPSDELYLHGLLSLTFAQNEPSANLYATPNWCLRQLGIIDVGRDGGKRYQDFRAAIHRLSGVQYSNDHFFDPLRGEHRTVSFGFLNYSLPVDPRSCRAWNFVHDAQWYSFCELARGSFSFDFCMYRQLDCAGRRLFLLLHKMLYRIKQTPKFDLRHLTVNVLGYSDSLQTKQLKSKLSRLLKALVDLHVIALPAGCKTPSDLIAKQEKGRYAVQFFRGRYFDEAVSQGSMTDLESPLVEPLTSIGFDQRDVLRIIRTYPNALVQEWADITLSAVEHNVVKQSPQQYFRYHIKRAHEKKTTPPDWWRELRKQEIEAHASETSLAQSDQAFDTFLAKQGREAFEKVMERMFTELRQAGQSEHDARSNAEHIARTNMRRQFRQGSGPESVGNLLQRYQ